MPIEPVAKRTIAFVDGQNLYHNARNVFGYNYPNYDVQKLAEAVCTSRGWKLERVQFYTGVPSPADNPFWHGFWSNKLAMMGRRGVAWWSSVNQTDWCPIDKPTYDACIDPRDYRPKP